MISKALDTSPAPRDDELMIQSDQACVACASCRCAACQAAIEVICLYCERGSVSAEPLQAFTVHHVWAIDAALARQLARWPSFRFDASQGCYANHCPRCGVGQDDDDLHSEPDQPFFSIAPGELALIPLVGRIRLVGDYTVDV